MSTKGHFEKKWKDSCKKYADERTNVLERDEACIEALTAIVEFLNFYAPVFSTKAQQVPEPSTKEEIDFITKISNELEEFRDFLSNKILIEISSWDRLKWSAVWGSLDEIKKSENIKKSWARARRLKPVFRKGKATNEDYESFFDMLNMLGDLASETIQVIKDLNSLKAEWEAE